MLGLISRLVVVSVPWLKRQEDVSYLNAVLCLFVVLDAPSCPGCVGSKGGPVLREGYHFYIFVKSYMCMLYSCMPGPNVLYK